MKPVGSAPSKNSFSIFGWYSRVSRYISSRTSSFVILRLSNSNSILVTGWAEGSLSTLAKPLKYGSASAYNNTICSLRKERYIVRSKMKRREQFTSSAVGRSLGSNASILSNKRSANGSAFGNFWEKGMAFFLLMLLKYLRAFSLRTCSYSAHSSAQIIIVRTCNRKMEYNKILKKSII